MKPPAAVDVDVMKSPVANEEIVVEMPSAFLLITPTSSAARRASKLCPANRLLLEEKLAAKLTDEVARKMRSGASIFE